MLFAAVTCFFKYIFSNLNTLLFGVTQLQKMENLL